MWQGNILLAIVMHAQLAKVVEMQEVRACARTCVVLYCVTTIVMT